LHPEPRKRRSTLLIEGALIWTKKRAARGTGGGAAKSFWVLMQDQDPTPCKIGKGPRRRGQNGGLASWRRSPNRPVDTSSLFAVAAREIRAQGINRHWAPPGRKAQAGVLQFLPRTRVMGRVFRLCCRGHYWPGLNAIFPDWRAVRVGEAVSELNGAAKQGDAFGWCAARQWVGGAREYKVRCTYQLISFHP